MGMPGRGVMSALPTPAKSDVLRSEARGVTRRTSRLMEELQPIAIHAASKTATLVITRNIFNLLYIFLPPVRT